MDSRGIEFNNRMAAQRRLLRAVNKADWWCEKLAGVSVDAIDRFARANLLTPTDDVVTILRSAGLTMQCLASKSQEQLTDEYAGIEREVEELQRKLESVMANNRLHRSRGTPVS